VKSILDPSFRYVPSYETDVRKTFERKRREQAEAAQVQSSGPIDHAPIKVVQLKTKQSST